MRLKIAVLVLALFTVAACTGSGPAADTDDLPYNWRLVARTFASQGDCVSALELVERAEAESSVLDTIIRAEFHDTGTCLAQDPQKAAELYRKIAGTGLIANATARLGTMHLQGLGVPQDVDAANRLFRQAAIILAISPQEIRRDLSAIYMGDRGVPDQLQRELDWLEEIENGGAERQFEEALRLREVEDSPMAGIVASLWFEQAGNKGLPLAHYELAQESLSNPEYPNDRVGLHWLGQAAAAGYGPAQREVGKRFAQGNGTSQSDVDAAVWLTKAAANGEEVEELLAPVGVRLSAEDAAKAATDARRTIEAPLIDRILTGEFPPGPVLFPGWAVLARASITEGECETGLDLYERARALGDTDAMVSLAELYEIGWCLPRSDQDAATLYLEASEGGEQSVWPILGHLYLNGIGVPRDPEIARYWLRGAALDGVFGETESDRLKNIRWKLRRRPVPAELRRAIDWAVRLESASAQKKYEMGLNLRDGIGIPASDDLAYTWLLRAAGADVLPAELEVAVGLLSGRFGQRIYSDQEGNRNYGRSRLRSLARGGYGPAQRELGLYFASVDNFYPACAWLLKAEANGADVANASASACARLSPADRESAERLSERDTLFLP